MIVLRETWIPSATIIDGGKFFLWGESVQSTSNKYRGRPPKIYTPPFKATEKDRLRILEFFDLKNNRNIYKKINSDNLIYLCPSYSKFPQSFPDLFCEENFEDIKESLEITPWKINGLNIPRKKAVLFKN